MNVEPLSIEVTTNPLFGDVDAVILPLNINEVSKSDIADLGILNNFSPLPLNAEPLFISIPPLTNKEPVNCEPLSLETTKNP